MLTRFASPSIFFLHKSSQPKHLIYGIKQFCICFQFRRDIRSRMKLHAVSYSALFVVLKSADKIVILALFLLTHYQPPNFRSSIFSKLYTRVQIGNLRGLSSPEFSILTPDSLQLQKTPRTFLYARPQAPGASFCFI